MLIDQVSDHRICKQILLHEISFSFVLEKHTPNISRTVFERTLLNAVPTLSGLDLLLVSAGPLRWRAGLRAWSFSC